MPSVPPGFRRNRRESTDQTDEITAINKSLWKLEQRNKTSLPAEISSSKEKSEQYLKESLRLAGETLGTAYDALTKHERRHGRSLSVDQVRATITAIQDESWWNELLEGHQLENSEAARSAVRNLASSVARLDADRVVGNPFEQLLTDIVILRQKINSVRKISALPSPGLVRQYVAEAYSVASQVMVGLIAVSTTAEASGTKVAPEVIYSAIGLFASASVARICRRTARSYKAKTIQAQLQKYHHDLIEAVTDLHIFLKWLTGVAPPNDDVFEILRNTALSASFLVSHLEQLAVTHMLPESSAYRGVLLRVRMLLNDVQNIKTHIVNRSVQAGQLGQNSKLEAGLRRILKRNQYIEKLRKELLAAIDQLRSFDVFIDK